MKVVKRPRNKSRNEGSSKRVKVVAKSGKRMKVVKRPRNKSRNEGSSKRVKVVAKSNGRSGSNNRRKVVRKGQRRVLPVGKKTVSATPLSIVGKSSSMGHKPLVTVPTRQEGEECGMCFNPGTDYFC